MPVNETSGQSPVLQVKVTVSRLEQRCKESKSNCSVVDPMSTHVLSRGSFQTGARRRGQLANGRDRVSVTKSELSLNRQQQHTECGC